MRRPSFSLLHRAPRPARGRLALRMALAVFVAGVVLETAIGIPAYFQVRQRFVEAAHEQARNLLAAAVDPSAYPSAETMQRIGADLVSRSQIAGGTIYSGAGEERARFGEAPRLDWNAARITGERTRFFSDAGIVETFLPSEETRIPYGIIVRVDSSRTWRSILDQLLERWLMSIAAMALLAAAIGMLTARWIARPVRAMAGSLDHALNAPEDAAARLTGVVATNELGGLAHRIDQMLIFTAASQRDELLPVASILDRLSHGILVFSAEGHLVSANAAALRMFGERSEAALASRPPEGLLRFESDPVVAASLLARGPVQGHGEILRRDGEIPALVSGDTLRNPDGTVLRQFLILVDMRGLLDEVRSEVLSRQSAEREASRLSAELRRFRRAFDACLVVMELDKADAPRPNAVTVQPPTLLQAWRARFDRDSPDMRPRLVFADLPPLLGDPGEMRRLFEITLETLRARSGRSAPEIAVSASLDADEDVVLTFTERARDGTAATISDDADGPIFIAAMAALCRRQSGALAGSLGADRSNVVTLRLRVDRTTLGTKDARYAASA